MSSKHVLVISHGLVTIKTCSCIHCIVSRLFVVYPWTRRYFGGFGNLFSTEAIMANPKVTAHGIVVLRGLEMALKNMDNIKKTYASLSTLHSEKLQVDPGNFQVCVSKQWLWSYWLCLSCALLFSTSAPALRWLHDRGDLYTHEGRVHPRHPSCVAEVPVCCCGSPKKAV